MKLTDYLAIYGALLSSAVFIWNAKRATPRINVRIAFASDRTDDGEYRFGIGISVQNPSSHEAHIASVSFLYPFRKPTLRERLEHLIRFKSLPLRIGWCHSALSLHGVDDECPASIEPGKSHWIFVPEDVIRKVLAEATSPHFRIVVQDALWRNKYSKKFVYELPTAKKAD